MANPNADPIGCNAIGEDGTVHNLVTLMNGARPIPGMTRTPSMYDPVCYRLVAEDGTVHNLVDLLKNISSTTELPEANEDHLGSILLYAGETTPSLQHGYFYECVETGGTYSWAPVSFGATPIAQFSGDTLVIT